MTETKQRTTYMTKIINLNNQHYTNKNLVERTPSAAEDQSEKVGSASIDTISYDVNRRLLTESYPGKLLFSIAEAASIIGTSYEFIRLRIREGKINIKTFGERKMIHSNELARLITEGL